MQGSHYWRNQARQARSEAVHAPWLDTKTHLEAVAVQYDALARLMEQGDKTQDRARSRQLMQQP